MQTAVFDLSGAERIVKATRAWESSRPDIAGGGRTDPQAPQVYWFAVVETAYAGNTDNPNGLSQAARSGANVVYGVQMPLAGEGLTTLPTGPYGGSDESLIRDTDGNPVAVIVGGIEFPVFEVDFSACVGRPLLCDLFAAVNNGGDWFAVGTYRNTLRCVFKEDGWAWIANYAGDNTQGTFQSPATSSGLTADYVANLLVQYTDPFGLNSGSDLVEGDGICIEWALPGPAQSATPGYILTYALCQEYAA